VAVVVPTVSAPNTTMTAVIPTIPASDTTVAVIIPTVAVIIPTVAIIIVVIPTIRPRLAWTPSTTASVAAYHIVGLVITVTITVAITVVVVVIVVVVAVTGSNHASRTIDFEMFERTSNAFVNNASREVEATFFQRGGWNWRSSNSEAKCKESEQESE